MCQPENEINSDNNVAWMERSAIQNLVDASLFVVSFRGGQLPPRLFAGGRYFFTVTLRDRGADYLIRDIHLLREAFRSVRRAHPFEIDAIVVLPDHLHCIWTLPEGDSNYPNRWRSIKGRFSRALAKTGRPIRRNSKGEYDVWQRRYWEHLVRDERDFQAHMDYIHYNPVKHGFVKRVCDWPYSSFHRFVRHGWISSDWAGDASVGDKSMGE